MRWIDDQTGATAIEYALIAAGIAMIIVAAIFLLGGDLDALFLAMAATMNNAAANLQG